MTVVPYSDDQPVGPVRARLERVPTLPDRHRAAAVARWWVTDGARRLVALLVRAPLLLLLELRPIGTGLGRIVMGWARWCNADTYAATIATNAGLGVAHKDDPARLEARRGRRRVLSALLGTVLVGLVWAAVLRWPGALVLGAGVLVLVCDAVGRRIAPAPTVALPPPARAVLTEGVPLTQITRAIVDRAAERWGLELGVARAMTYSHERREYEVTVTCSEALTRDHMADFERAIGAADHSMRCLAPPDRRAGTRRLVIREGDPLAEPVPAPVDIPRGSITEWVELGVSMTDVPFALPFAGVHMRIVMGTGGGKSAWALRGIIRGLAGRRDVVLGGIDITNGPELTLWRGVIQHRGLDPEGAERVLDLALAEIARRGAVLSALAEDDDPDNDVSEWHSGLGPAFVILVDEFAQLAVFDGKGKRADLLGKCEQIVRTGRKHWVSMVMLTQRTGNDDFGSTTMSSQCGVTVAGPCDPADTVRMFGVELRDAGYQPHLLSPGVEGDIRDAGKVYLSSPAHRTPDLYRFYAPGSTAEVKRIARQLVDQGLPVLGGPAGTVDAVEVPTLLVDVERAFVDAGVGRLATAELLEAIRPGGWDLDERALAEQLRPFGVASGRWRPSPGANPVRGYALADVRAALEGLA